MTLFFVVVWLLASGKIGILRPTKDGRGFKRRGSRRAKVLDSVGMANRGALVGLKILAAVFWRHDRSTVLDEWIASAVSRYELLRSGLGFHRSVDGSG